MDIRCPRCGEPWEHDSLHDMPESSIYHRNYARAAQDFQRFGCGLFAAAWDGKALAPCPRSPSPAGEEAAAIYEAVGGDLDAASSMLADLEGW